VFDLDPETTELGADAARAIAAAMREVSRVDGETPAELQLITDFEAVLGVTGAPSADLASIRSRGDAEALMKSIILVAFADGGLSHGERAVIQQYADRVGWSQDEVTAAVTTVAETLLSRFSGVRIFRDQVEDIGRGLGLTQAQVGRIIG
jgi:hypothetical protein